MDTRSYKSTWDIYPVAREVVSNQRIINIQPSSLNSCRNQQPMKTSGHSGVDYHLVKVISCALHKPSSRVTASRRNAGSGLVNVCTQDYIVSFILLAELPYAELQFSSTSSKRTLSQPKINAQDIEKTLVEVH